MKPSSFLRPWSLPLWLLAATFALSVPATASERFSLPPPSKVVKDIRGFINRVKNGVKDASKQTWNAIRDPFISDEEDEDEEVTPRRRSTKPASTPTENKSSFSRSKEAVPYRYDDAEKNAPRSQPDRERMGPPDEPLPSVRVGSSKSEPASTPPPTKTESTPDSRRPFMTPEEKPAPPPSSASTPPTSPMPNAPKATPPGVDSNLEFGRPVPGKRGLVYPPGANDSSENMVDVSDFKTGQIVRDPRTGKLFRVP